ncbi:archaemetzincin family Zn-dependent metalloprotease [Thermococcus radiotolerans]|uniref:Archaemetzincin n=1 Tax=Thermococcus radiotolerans TaxID=187880 RepID=A0A2Z2N097_9EURY|nr:archaemetzincin family Zn-dependent metalloprotease [Thermococcus radiotolerans]ASJ14347.1 archemetzincin [Thermococcus radiotolerans]
MILLVPIGRIDGRVIEAVREFVGSYYTSLGLPVAVSDALPEDLFSDAYNPLRRQYLGRRFLPALSEVGRKRRARAVLGITNLDLYEEGLNFIFGLAHSGLGAAVISTFRLRPEFYGEAPDERLFVERTIKEAMHELGHVFGLGHCPDERCVMHFSNSIVDTDIKEPVYCPPCLRRLKKNLEVGL